LIDILISISHSSTWVDWNPNEVLADMMVRSARSGSTNYFKVQTQCRLW